ncbi:PKD domain-containing protein [Candidatus Gracilibacteria bacterium 28_42_T64]|nr:PKD domain-containing protein [Candidatus Gracilibacteria bacterium 28_42_T64]
MRRFIFLFYFLFTFQVYGNSGLILTESIEDVKIPELSLGNTQTGITIKKEEVTFVVPDFNVIFQNPSYIKQKNQIQDIYVCDETKDECKVNFKIVDNQGKDISTKLLCEIFFSSDLEQINKCNPTTIIFPEGETEVLFKIVGKKNGKNYKERKIVIKKEIVEVAVDLENETGTGEIIGELGSGESQTGSVEGNTGVIDTGSGLIVSTGSIGEVPDLVLDIQSGLEYSGTGNIWNCKKEECKINLDLSLTFTGSFQEKNYTCIWNFGGGTYKTQNTSEKCNPGYVNYSTGTFEIEYKIYEKENDKILKKSTIIIQNIWSQIEENGSEQIESGTGDIETATGVIALQMEGIDMGTGTIQTGSLAKLPEIVLDIQSGLEYSGTGNIWKCIKEDCKVNLDVSKSFTGELKEKDYECLWSFGSGSYQTNNMDQKCNPGYIDYETGTFEIIVKILEKGNNENYNEKSIVFQNIILKEEKGVKRNVGSGGGTSRIESVKNIIIQSGLDENNTCRSEICKVNFKYQNSYQERCIWDFGGGNVKEKYITSCNPGLIYYRPGDYKLQLTIYNKKYNTIIIKNLEFKNTYISMGKKNNRAPNAVITLQGKETKTKSIQKNRVVCRGVEKCNINLTGTESSDPDRENLRYFWDFGNGISSDKSNPAGMWYETGKYEVTLRVRDKFGEESQDSFFVEVLDNGAIEENFIDHNIFSNLKIHALLANPDGNDTFEYIEIKNTGTQKLNLSGLIIDDTLKKGSREYVIKKESFLNPGKIRRFYKNETHITLNNSVDEVHLIYNNTNIDTLFWDFEMPSGYILNHDNGEFTEQKVMVERVVDGDTIVIKYQNGKTEKLRLVGVDTPETKHPKKEVQFYGKEASNFTKMMLEGKNIVIKQNVRNYRDKYGRLLGYVYLPGKEEKDIFFNKLLIEKGYARAYLRFPFQYSVQFKKAQNKAKKQRIGIWSEGEIKKEMLALAQEEKVIIAEIEEEEEEIFLGEEYQINMKQFVYFVEKEILKKEKKISIFSQSQMKNSKKYFSQLWDGSGKIISSKGEKRKRVHFSKTIKKQKKSLKIYGNTEANLKIFILLGNKEYMTVSDSTGKYSIKITDLSAGDFHVSFRVEDQVGQIFAIKKQSYVTLDENYVNTVLSYKKKEIVSQKKIKNKKKSNTFIITSLADDVEIVGMKANFQILYFLLFLLIFIFSSMILKRSKVF